MKLLQEIKERAQSNPQRIVLPEGDEPRTLEAANTVIKDKVAEIILLGNPEKIMALAAEKGFDKIHSHRESLQDTTAERNEIRIRSRKEQLRKAIVKIIHFLTQKKLV